MNVISKLLKLLGSALHQTITKQASQGSTESHSHPGLVFESNTQFKKVPQNGVPAVARSDSFIQN
jgi:hypothetical protein